MGELIFLENGGSNIPKSGSITEIQDISPLVQQYNNKNKPDIIQKQVLLSIIVKPRWVQIICRE